MCIGCGACVDACNQVMDKLDYPKGLIRYTSERGILEKLSPKAMRESLFRPRVLIYSIVMLLLVAIFIGTLATRTTLRVDVIRDRGMLGREVAGGMIENVYRLQLMNASEQPLVLSLGVEGLPGMSVALADRASVPLTDEKQSGTVQSTSHINVASASNRLIAVVVRAPGEGAQPGPQPIRFTMKSLGANGAVLTEIKEASSFIFPR
jgi:polyferredoxin